MFFNRYIFFVILAGSVSAVSLLLVILRMDPFTDGTLALSLFFLSFFFCLSSTFTIIGYTIRLFFYRDELFLNHFNISLRQGMLLTACLSALLGLQALGRLVWWIALLVMAVGFLLELYFVAKEQ